MMLCEQCKQHPVEYDSPGKWCRHCWAAWWVDGMEITDEKEKQKYLQEVLDDIQTKYGDEENVATN
jgi:hypothetical protein